MLFFFVFVFFQAEDGIRDLVRSRGLGDVYKRQDMNAPVIVVSQADFETWLSGQLTESVEDPVERGKLYAESNGCLLYTSDAADERSSVDLGGRRIIKKKKTRQTSRRSSIES